MPTDVVMPQMGESIFEGTITKWLKKAGDRVEKDEPLFEISTDKVDAEIPSPVAGVLSEIKSEAGTTVAINTVVAVIAQPGEAGKSGEAAAEARVPEAADGSAAPALAANASARPAPTSIAPAPPRSAGTDVVMPQMGESIFEGTITKWLKQVGDTVAKDEPLFEISTDKVDAEIPAPVAGVLSQIKSPAGATVEINTVVAVIGGVAAIPAETEPAEAVPEASAPIAAETSSEPDVAPPTSNALLRSSPLVRRMAKEHNLDLGRISGTGSAARITKQDVLKYLASGAPQTAPATDRRPAGESTPAPSNSAASTLPGTVVPLSRMRAIIAQRMAESVAISPHVYSVYKIDMTRAVQLRERERGRFEQQHGVKLTYMPFIAAAAVEALRQHPIVNASLLTEPNPNGPPKPTAIQYHANVHLGIAVALEWGLIVPVIRNAETLSFVDLARTIADLAERARTKKLKPEEASGSTFTLTNSGVFGGEFGTPIINQPESAILAIGGLKKEPVVLSTDGSDSIAIRSMQSYCLGFDHRLIDGADGGKFLSTFKQTLEGWDRELG